jgi:hypothetical protein
LVPITRINADGSEEQVDHTGATRTELTRAIAFARSVRSSWQGNKQIGVLATFEERLHQMDRDHGRVGVRLEGDQRGGFLRATYHY